MGVMGCFRNGCNNVMCSRLSNTHGYICGECLEELLESDTIDIEEFMRSPKNSDNINQSLREARREAIEEEFRWV
jgi:hypothetical protein